VNEKENSFFMANFQLGDTEKVSYALTVLDADSNPANLLPGDTVSVFSSDTTSATIVPDSVPAAGSVASGFVVGGKKVQVGVSITAAITHADGSLGLSVVDLIDIVGGTASSISLGFGAPVAQ
jgi:hypothetical protein